MKTLQLVTLLVTSLTLALVTTALIIMSVAWVSRPPCAACPPTNVVIDEDEIDII